MSLTYFRKFLCFHPTTNSEPVLVLVRTTNAHKHGGGKHDATDLPSLALSRTAACSECIGEGIRRITDEWTSENLVVSRSISTIKEICADAVTFYSWQVGDFLHNSPECVDCSSLSTSLCVVLSRKLASTSTWKPHGNIKGRFREGKTKFGNLSSDSFTRNAVRLLARSGSLGMRQGDGCRL